MARIGIIGGSGLYKIEGIKNVKERKMTTPFGSPSDKIITGELSGVEVAFLPRHGIGHRINPSQINYRANIFAMKKIGVERIISLSACGSLKEEYRPMDFVLADQFVDRTNQARKMTFLDCGIVGHIGFANPTCGDLSQLIYNSAKKLGLNVHLGGTYLNMEGPAFSTKAESNLYRSWGMDIIGMTNMSEAKLAREAEICYSTLAAVTDYDCWHETHESVSVDMIIEYLNKNVDNAKKIIKDVITKIPQERTCPCKDALKYALITSRDVIPSKVKKDLHIILGKYLK
ncbi:MAG: S-methyl-5'-thioadenosine phosphorylase [Candidatus Omnitrophica bacterium]|nr:S-methyl-5'-thioadenosine phosphorylase [Candidatus Omnitrophota bacterium]MDD5352781.1 S-methyl-5'-thioadenosine phosphorylase [Candidatus Omnitrophota bacterium]MDD5550380.1 S-methyl-5'-thioadenosine phosphorylase [Candidatus Omnitrophota bacterium]